MKVTRITGGPLQTNAYLLTDTATGATAVVDPGFESQELTDAIRSAGTENVRAILLTHGHFDHMMGVNSVKKLTNAKIYLYADEAPFISDVSLNLAYMMGSDDSEAFSPDVLLNDGDTIELGDMQICVLHTPGHTAGSCCYLVENAVFSGDTLMKGTCGRTDFPTGNYPQMLASLKKISAVKGNYRVCPGHESETTLNEERKNNPYMGKDGYDLNS